MYEETYRNSIEKKETINFSDLTIYTATLYGDDDVSNVRQPLAEKFIENTAKLGIKCVLIDGGSNEKFINFAKSFPNVKIEIDPHLGMGESRRRGLNKAMEDVEAQYFLWVEPEKYDLINTDDLGRMITGLKEDQTDIVVPKRSSMETLTKFQTWIESRANKRAMEIAGVNEQDVKEVWDLWFGPKMFNREGAKFFQEYSGKLDKWDSIIKPVVNAYQAGKRISSVSVDYSYDTKQTEAEENDREMKKKRIIQYVSILAEMGDEFWQDKIANIEKDKK